MTDNGGVSKEEQVADEQVTEEALPEVALTAPVAEYLEKSIADSLKREIDQEENVVRSLPFFATSIGVLLASIGLVRPSLDKIPSGLFLWVAYGLAALTLGSIILITYYLFQATKRRQQYLPMMETAHIAYARSLISYHSVMQVEGVHATVEARDKAVVLDLRSEQLQQLAVYAESLREVNLARLSMRARMFRLLCFAVIVALAQVLYTMVLTHEPMEVHHAQAAAERPGKRDQAATDATNSAENAGGGERAVGCEGCRPDQREGSAAKVEGTSAEDGLTVRQPCPAVEGTVVTPEAKESK